MSQFNAWLIRSKIGKIQNMEEIKTEQKNMILVPLSTVEHFHGS